MTQDPVIRDRLVDCFREKDRRPIHEWASDNLSLPSVLTLTGRFSADRSRHFIPILEALQDDHVRQVVVRKPVRGGGTLISDIWHCWTRANDPGPAMAVLQTDKIADDHAEARLMPMMLTCPGVASKLSDDRHKNRANEIMFSDGLPLYVTGPGINNLQTKGIRYMSLDEIWLYKPGVVEEAEGRLGDFARIQTSKLLIVSQAGDEHDDLDIRWKDGSQHWWHVPCLRCGKLMDLKWGGVRQDGTRWGMVWDEHRDERGHWLPGRCSESVRYECRDCGHPHMDNPKTKAEWNARGEYVAQNPGASRSKRSFHWNLIISDNWQDMVEKYLGAVNAYKIGVIDPLLAFFQKRMAEPVNEGVLSEASVEFARVEAGEWPAEFMRFMTCDRQGEDLFWVLVRGWSRTGETRRIWFGRATGHAELKEIANRYQVKNVFIDAGFEAKTDRGVYAICCRYNWVAFKGDKTREFVHETKKGRVMRSYAPVTQGDPESGTEYEGRKTCPLIRFSSDTMADRVNALIRAKSWTEPLADPSDPMELEYRRQMTAERKRKKEDKNGRTVWEWVQTRRDNHAFDCAKMQIVAATLADILPDQEIA